MGIDDIIALNLKTTKQKEHIMNDYTNTEAHNVVMAEYDYRADFNGDVFTHVMDADAIEFNDYIEFRGESNRIQYAHTGDDSRTIFFD